LTRIRARRNAASCSLANCCWGIVAFVDYISLPAGSPEVITIHLSSFK
jgi:hypothetical protein